MVCGSYLNTQERISKSFKYWGLIWGYNEWKPLGQKDQCGLSFCFQVGPPKLFGRSWNWTIFRAFQENPQLLLKTHSSIKLLCQEVFLVSLENPLCWNLNGKTGHNVTLTCGPLTYRLYCTIKVHTIGLILYIFYSNFPIVT